MTSKAVETSEKFNWIAITTLVSLIVPFLYIVGRTYYESYLNVYGITIDLFQRSTQDYLYFALTTIFQVIWKGYKSSSALWPSLLIFAGNIAILIFIYTLINSYEPKTVSKWFERRVFLRRLAGSALIGVISMVIFYCVIVLLFIIMLLPLQAGQSIGKWTATDEIKQDMGACSNQHRSDLTACVQISKDDKIIALGRVIASSDSHVAVASEGKAIVLSKEGLSFEIVKPSSQ